MNCLKIKKLSDSNLFKLFKVVKYQTHEMKYNFRGNQVTISNVYTTYAQITTRWGFYTDGIQLEQNNNFKQIS